MQKKIVKENWKNVSAEMLEEKIKYWREQMVDDINENFAGKVYTDSIVSSVAISNLVRDVLVLTQWCEILANKIKKLEKRK